MWFAFCTTFYFWGLQFQSTHSTSRLINSLSEGEGEKKCSHDDHEHDHQEVQRVDFEDHVQGAGEHEARKCPCCGWTGPKFNYVTVGKGRSDARCPVCQAMERHRNSCAFVGTHPEILDVVKEEKGIDAQQSALRLLHFGPHPAMGEVLDNSSYKLDQIWMDYDENHNVFNGRRVVDAIWDTLTFNTWIKPTKTVHADVQKLRFPDNFAHGVMIFHVMEHIPDIEGAFEELGRVLKPDGWMMIEVPMRDFGFKESIDCRGLESDTARLKCAGQKDHVWKLGRKDFEQRLAAVFDCSNVEQMTIERVGQAAYDAYQTRANGRTVPQYFCRVKPKRKMPSLTQDEASAVVQ